MRTMKFAAAGDVFITRPIPLDPAFAALSEVLHESDVRFCNLETTFASTQAHPATVSGGTWARSDPRLLTVIEAYGFNAIAAATNHAGDFGETGLCDTIRALEGANASFAGIGRNLHEASRPAMLDTPAGRVALISLASTFSESSMAGAQRHDMIGRPGVNPLRHSTVHTLPPNAIEQLRDIGEALNINAREKLRVAEGFSIANGQIDYSFGGIAFKSAEKAGTVTSADERDIERTLKGIGEGRELADFVIVSIHSHEMAGDEKTVPAGFLVDSARRFIDAGAHAVLCHGPHVMRGIEIHRERPIFYSLGNFVFQNETVAALPSDFYEKYGMEESATVAQALNTRSGHGKRGLQVNADVWSAVIPQWTMRGERLTSLSLRTISLGFCHPRWVRGTPQLSADRSALEKLQALSHPFGTRLDILSDGSGRVRLD